MALIEKFKELAEVFPVNLMHHCVKPTMDRSPLDPQRRRFVEEEEKFIINSEDVI